MVKTTGNKFCKNVNRTTILMLSYGFTNKFCLYAYQLQYMAKWVKIEQNVFNTFVKPYVFFQYFENQYSAHY